MATKRILVFGTGVFLRGFLMDFASRAGFSMTVVSSTAAGDARIDALKAAQGCVSIWLRGIDLHDQVVDKTQQIRVVDQFFKASDNFEDVLRTAQDPNICIVSSNVSEVGFQLAKSLADDLKAVPSSFPARLERWLYARFLALPEAELTVLPCELIAKNGLHLRNMVLTAAKNRDADEIFMEWLIEKVLFCDTLVDRICTPNPDDSLGAIVEPHTFWALKSPVGLAVKQLANATDGQIVVAESIENYQLRKVRLLNGLHTAMASIATSKFGISTVREALEHSELGPFLERMLFDELVPTIVPPVAMDEAMTYAKLTLRRMRNPFLQHQLSAISVGADEKWKARLLPAIDSYVEKFGFPPESITTCQRIFLESKS